MNRPFSSFSFLQMLNIYVFYFNIESPLFGMKLERLSASLGGNHKEDAMKKMIVGLVVVAFAIAAVIPLSSHAAGIVSAAPAKTVIPTKPAADLKARPASVLSAAPTVVPSPRPEPNQGDPLYIQAGIQNDQISRIKTDFNFSRTVSRNNPGGMGSGSNAAGGGCTHCNDGPEDPIGCLNGCGPNCPYMSPTANISTGFVRGGEDYGNLTGTKPTIYEALYQNLPEESAVRIMSLLESSYMAEFGALGLKNREDFLNAPKETFCNAGKILQKYDISMGAWEPTSVITNDRLKAACGIELNFYSLTDSGLAHARQVLGNSNLKNFNHREALEMIKQGM